MSEFDQLSGILNLIGFSVPAKRIAIIDDVFTMYNELISLRERNISKLAEAFDRRTISNGKIILGVR